MERIETTLVSDLSGSEHAETVKFSFGSAHYEVDLTKDERTAMMRLLQPYIEHGRKVSSDRRPKG